MGRHVAGAGFLSAMARYSAAPELVAWLRVPDHFADFEAGAKAANLNRTVRYVPATDPLSDGGVGCFFIQALYRIPEPGTHEGRDNAGSACVGIKHATASERAMAAVTADGRNPDIRRDVWHAADVFASPSDNIQETLGPTPVEAMAAGLSSVISD